MRDTRDKLKYLQWISTHLRHVDPMVDFLLKFIISNKDYLDFISLTNTIDPSTRALFISYKEGSTEPFLYYKGNLTYDNSEQAFHDLRLNLIAKREQFFLFIDLTEAQRVNYKSHLDVPSKSTINWDDMLYDVSERTHYQYLIKMLDVALDHSNLQEAEKYGTVLQRYRGESS